jgi:hypothetical protein
MARRPGAAPGRLSFGDSAVLLARGAWCSGRAFNPVAPSRKASRRIPPARRPPRRPSARQGDCAPRGSGWFAGAADILQGCAGFHCTKMKRAGSLSRSRPKYGQTKNKHRRRSLSLRPQAFRGGRFGVWGTPLPKPFVCKNWEIRSWHSHQVMLAGSPSHAASPRLLIIVLIPFL